MTFEESDHINSGKSSNNQPAFGIPTSASSHKPPSNSQKDQLQQQQPLNTKLNDSGISAGLSYSAYTQSFIEDRNKKTEGDDGKSQNPNDSICFTDFGLQGDDEKSRRSVKGSGIDDVENEYKTLMDKYEDDLKTKLSKVIEDCKN